MGDEPKEVWIIVNANGRIVQEVPAFRTEERATERTKPLANERVIGPFRRVTANDLPQRSAKGE